MQIGSANHKRWAVILAGGEGVRLRSLTRLVSGDDTPKKFCPLLRVQIPALPAVSSSEVSPAYE